MTSTVLSYLSNIRLRQVPEQLRKFEAQLELASKKSENTLALVKELSNEHKSDVVVLANLIWTIRHTIVGDVQKLHTPADKNVMKNVLSISMNLHDLLVTHPSHKLLNECIQDTVDTLWLLDLESFDATIKMLLTVLEKKELNNFNWASSILGKLASYGGYPGHLKLKKKNSGLTKEEFTPLKNRQTEVYEELTKNLPKISEIFVQRLQKEIFVDKPNPKAVPMFEKFNKSSFNLVTKEVFQNKIWPELVKMYRRNSVNIPLVKQFLGFFSIGFLNSLDESVQLQLPDMKVLEGVIHATPAIMQSSLETLWFLLKLKNVEVKKHILKQLAPKIKSKQIDYLKYEFCLMVLSLNLKELGDEILAKEIVEVFADSLDQLKSEEQLEKIQDTVIFKGDKFGKTFLNLSSLDALLKKSKLEIQVFIKYHLISHILYNITAQDPTRDLNDAEKNQVEKVLKEIYISELEPNFIKNPVRICNSSISAITAFNTLFRIRKRYSLQLDNIGAANLKSVVQAFNDNLFYFYSKPFNATKPEYIKKLLVKGMLSIGELVSHVTNPSFANLALFTLFLQNFSEKDFKEIHKLQLSHEYFILLGKATLQIHKLKSEGQFDWCKKFFEKRSSFGNIFDSIIGPNIHLLVPQDSTKTLEAFDAYAVLTFVASTSKCHKSDLNSSSNCDKFQKFILENGRSEQITSGLNFPGDMAHPSKHYILGYHGLFSRHMDRRDFWCNMSQLHLAFDQTIFFEQYIKFFEFEGLVEKKDVYEKNTEIELKNLEDSFYYLKDFGQFYTEIGYAVKQPVKQQPVGKTVAGKAPAPISKAPEFEVRDVKIEHKTASDIQLMMVKENENYAKYAFFLERLSQAASKFVDCCLQSNVEGVKLTLMNDIKNTNLFNNLKQIVSQIPALSEAVKPLLITILKNLMASISTPEFANQFAYIFYGILKFEKNNMAISDTEQALYQLHNIRENTGLHPVTFPLFLEFSIFCFSSLFDGEARRRSFEIIISLANRPECSSGDNHLIFQFIKSNLNTLRYNDTTQILAQVCTKLHKETDQLINQMFGEALEYQPFAAKILLEVLLNLDQDIRDSQKIDQFSKIKLSIMIKGDDHSNSELASEVLNKLGGELDYELIMSLDFTRFAKEIPFDLHKLTGKILNDSVSCLDNQHKTSFFNKILTSYQLAIEDCRAKLLEEQANPTGEHDVESIEEGLDVYNVILEGVISSCPSDSLHDLFSKFMGKVTYLVINLIEYESEEFQVIGQRICDIGCQYIDHNKDQATRLIKIFEENIEKRSNVISPIIFLAAAAKHLENKNNIPTKFKDLSEKIISLADQDNSNFQKKLGINLPGLLIFFGSVESLVSTVLAKVQTIDNPSQIRGRCYLMVGMIRGLGIKKVDHFKLFGCIEDIINKSTKKDLKDIPKHKKYFIIYTLTALWDIFGKIFEPKFPEILPKFMLLFGDLLDDIRELSTDVLSVAMAKMSGYGIKKMVPILLEGCRTSNTRAKLSNIAALGSMAHCASKQLASHLPDIIPELTKSTGDTNPGIQDAAVKSLSLILSTIKSPEVMNIRDTLIKALSSPFDENARALDALLTTRFSHMLDAPSLALVMPIILYGLKKNKDSTQREKASKVAANIVDLVKDSEDILPYLPSLTDGLKSALGDMETEIRATTSKAVGRIIRKIGRVDGAYLINGLQQVIEGETANTLERSGTAQAFCECLATLGDDEIARNSAQIFEGAKDKRQHIRESFLNMLVFLPLIMDQKFEPFISNSLNAALFSIDHTNQNIRQLAIRAVRNIIKKFSDNNLGMVLSALFEGMFSDNSIKRESAITLIGEIIDTLFKENLTKEEIYKKSPEVFTALYIVKHDQVPDIKLLTDNIWKSYADNTMRCLQCIYPVWIDTMVGLYISGSVFQKLIADLCMQVFTNKYIDVFFNQIFDHFNDKISNFPDAKFQSGMCQFISSLLQNINLNYMKQKRTIMVCQIISKLLQSEEEIVYFGSLETFKVFHKRTKEFDFMKEELDSMIEEIEAFTSNEEQKDDPDALRKFDKNMKVFKKMAGLNLNKVGKYFEKVLLEGEVKTWKFEILADCSKVFSNSMYKNGILKPGLRFFIEKFTVKFQVFTPKIQTNMDTDTDELILYSMKELVGQLAEDSEGLLVSDCLEFLKTYINKPEHQFKYLISGLDSLTRFYTDSGVECQEYQTNLFDTLVPLLTDTTERSDIIFQKLAELLEVIFMRMDKIEIGQKIEYIDHSLRNKIEKSSSLPFPGLNHPNILRTIFYLISQGLNIGDSRVCAICLVSLSFLCGKLNSEMLREYSHKILGTLIRICNYKHDDSTKLKVVRSLHEILKKLHTSLDNKTEQWISSSCLHQLASQLIVFLSKTDNGNEIAADFETSYEVPFDEARNELMDMIDELSGQKMFTVKKWIKRACLESSIKSDVLLKFVEDHDSLLDYYTDIQAILVSRDLKKLDDLLQKWTQRDKSIFETPLINTSQKLTNFSSLKK